MVDLPAQAANVQPQAAEKVPEHQAGSNQPDSFWQLLAGKKYVMELDSDLEGIFVASLTTDPVGIETFLRKVKSAIETHSKKTWGLLLLPEGLDMASMKHILLGLLSAHPEGKTVLFGPELGSCFSESWKEDVGNSFSVEENLAGRPVRLDVTLTYAVPNFLTQPSLKRDLWASLIEISG